MTLQNRLNLGILVLLASTTISLQAQQTLDRFLVPIHLLAPVQGAYGSVWHSELWVLNTGDETVQLDDLGPSCSFDCPGEPIPPQRAIAATAIRGLIFNGIPGAILRASSSVADNLVFQSRFFDSSRINASAGASLPVVRESQTPSGDIHLLGVPVSPQYRQMLRVYTFDQVPGRSARVRIYAVSAEGFGDTGTDPLLADVVVPIRFAATFTQPGYAQLGEIQSLPALQGHDFVRLVITPGGPFKIWAMVSLTNNATQEVTVILPNHAGRRGAA
jgi:hypothetical protein